MVTGVNMANKQTLEANSLIWDANTVKAAEARRDKGIAKRAKAKSDIRGHMKFMKRKREEKDVPKRPEDFKNWREGRKKHYADRKTTGT